MRVLPQNEQLHRMVDEYQMAGLICGDRWPSGARSMSQENLTAPQ
jgi:hypothetical protein